VLECFIIKKNKTTTKQLFAKIMIKVWNWFLHSSILWWYW